MVVVDAGNNLVPNKRFRGDDPQVAFKAGLIAESLMLGGLDAIVLGPRDWELGVDTVQELVKEHGLPVVAANLKCGGKAPYPASKIVQAGDRKLGIVGVTGGKVPGCEVSDARAGVEAALASLDVDFIVLLAPVDKGGASAFEGLAVDLVIDAVGTGSINAAPTRLGSLWVTNPGQRGKYLGLADLGVRSNGAGNGLAPEGYADILSRDIERFADRIATAQEKAAGAKPNGKARYEKQIVAYGKRKKEAEAALAAFHDSAGAHSIRLRRVPLNAGIADHAATKARVEAVKQQISDSAGSEGATRFRSRLAPANSKYAGGQVCQVCHLDQHTQWASTRHSRAYATLIKENRHLDAECWSCHSTAAGMEGGPQTPHEVGGMVDVQCEACHGPSRAHASKPTLVKPVKTPDAAVCTTCHDGERDEGRFDLGTYLPKVAH